MIETGQSIGLEVCIASLADARSAVQGGAFRVELNSALELGGLTPSIGLTERVVEALKPLNCKVIAMARPRPGGFAYNADERDVIHRDIQRLIDAGVDGIALGVLQDGGKLHAKACAELIAPVLASGREAVFHRAIDLTPDPIAALDTLVDLGYHRVLTSGTKATAMQGAGVIRSLVEHAADRIEVLPGGGVRPHNVRELIAATGCTQVHASLRSLRDDPSTSANPGLGFSSTPPDDARYSATDQSKVEAMLAALQA